MVDDSVSAADRLLELLHVDPRAAEARARACLTESAPDALESAKLRWVVGLALRSAGQLDDALVELELAHRESKSVGDSTVAARIGSSLAFLVGQQGDVDRAMSLLRSVQPELSGVERAKATGQLGTILYWRGELTEAARHLSTSCDELESFGDHVYAARYRGNLGAVLGLLGDYDEAERHLRSAISSAETFDLDLEAGLAGANLGYVANLRGDLPSALMEFARAEGHYARANQGALLPRLHADHAQALADAGLFDDAESLVQAATATFLEQGQQTELAGTLLTSAEIRLAQNDLVGAVDAAKDAGARFSAQGRASWAAVAHGLELQARARSFPDEGNLPEELIDTARALEEGGWGAESTRCRLVAARLLANSPTARDPVSPALRAAVQRGRTSDRILLADVDAISAIGAGDRPRARRAITRGLKIAMSSQAALGSIETRAHAAVHGFALTELGARLAIADRRPRELLARIEASRLMSSRTPDVRPPDDPEMAALLTELRSLNGTIAEPSATQERRREAEYDRVRVEREVRRRSRTARGDAAAIGVRDELGSALAMLAERHLLAYAALDGRLYAVSVVSRQARLHNLGELEGVSEMIGEIAFSLNRLNRAQGSEASRTAAAEMLYMVADELAELLVPKVIADAMDPVIVVPTAVLHDVPWGLLPPLGGRAVSINPSVSAWARAERTRQERTMTRVGRRSPGFVAGPGLEFAELEVEHLAAEYIDPEVFTGAEATGAACVDLLGRADVVHIACHGSFRTDNPMFSSLHLADGPLIVHDLERIERLPETVILPACSVAGTKVLQGGSVLGLANALMTLGACNVIAPLTPINDALSVTVMQRLHRELGAGAAPAAALAAATMSHDLADPTAAAFIALGA